MEKEISANAGSNDVRDSKTRLIRRRLREQEFRTLYPHVSVLSCLFSWPGKSFQISPVFFPQFMLQGFCPHFLSSLRATGQMRGDAECNYYPVTLTLELAATKMAIIRLFTETRPTSQSFSQITGHVY